MALAVLVILFALNVNGRTVLQGNSGGLTTIAAIQDSGTTRNSATSGSGTIAGLTYFGGPLIANVQVIPVFVQLVTLKGKTTTVIPVTYASRLADFYSCLASSTVLTWLGGQYSAGIYSIGTGSTLEPHIYNLSSTTNSFTIDDVAIQAIVKALIPNYLNSGSINLANAYFALHFAPGITITESRTKSCVNFCAYHGTIIYNTTNHVPTYGYYGVIPELATGTCANGCNCYQYGSCNPTNGSDRFAAVTTIASHEFIEAITDPAVGQAPTYASPLGWYDRTDNEEIGDLCNQWSVLYTGCTAQYYIQREWSNSDHSCYPLPNATTWN